MIRSLLICFAFSCAVIGQHEQIKDLNGKSDNKRIMAIFALHKMGKEAIPLLIDVIPNKEEMFAPLNHPLSSRIGSTRCHIGRLAAYGIELILGREKLTDPKSKRDLEYILGSDHNNYVYLVGIIVKEKDELISATDLIDVQQVYKAWWEKNKDKSLEELRSDWKQGIGPLSNSRYSWK